MIDLSEKLRAAGFRDAHSRLERNGCVRLWVRGEMYVWTPLDQRQMEFGGRLEDLFDDDHCQTEGMHAARTGVML